MYVYDLSDGFVIRLLLFRCLVNTWFVFS